MGVVLQYRPRIAAPAVSEACKWHEAIESVTRSNIRILGAWQRLALRAMWGL